MTYTYIYFVSSTIHIDADSVYILKVAHQITCTLLLAISAAAAPAFIAAEGVNSLELPSPTDVVQKGAQVESIIVWRVGLCMVCRGESCELVAVDGVIEEEPLDLHNC